MVIHCQNTSSFALFQGGEAEEETRKKRSGGAPLSSTFIKVAKVSSSSFVLLLLLLFSRQSASLIKIRIDFDRFRKRKKQNTNEATRDDDDDEEEDSHHHENAPLHDFGSNGSSESTSSGVHPTDKRIVGLSFPSTGVPVLPARGAADDDDDMPKMPADATTPSAT